MDGNRKFRSRALLIKTALRFITKTRRKSLYSSENISSESLSISASSSTPSNLSKDLCYHQEKYQKRKLSMSEKTREREQITDINQSS
jgi:hypothetical protein